MSPDVMEQREEVIVWIQRGKSTEENCENA